MNIHNTIIPTKTEEGFEVFGIEFSTEKEAKEYCEEFVEKKLVYPSRHTKIEVASTFLFHVYHVEGEHRQYLFSYNLLSTEELEVFLISQKYRKTK